MNFSRYDMYSKRIGFFFNGQEKIGSFFGIFLTLAYICVSSILFIYQIIRTIHRKELKVYDTSIYAQEMPEIEVDINQLYFAFALEDPLTSNRFIDESIYTAKLAFIDKKKKNDEFETVNTTQLEIESCNVKNFGKNYQHLFMQDELTNAYCIKNFNYSFPLAGGYKYERLTYLRLRIYPCVNSTKNNYSCKPQEVIDRYLTSGYFSIVIKDFGLNPSNYSNPVLPTFQDLYTTIDKRIYRNYILNFGVTEVHTDTGLINENLKIDRYLQYRKEIQTFSFRDERDYYAGKSVILVQLRLDDTLLIQTRSYTKIPEIFSIIGGYMQLMNTVFLLISSIINKFHSDLEIINSIFKFNIKENKLLLKLQSLKEGNINTNIKDRKNRPIPNKRPIDDIKQLENFNKSKNNLIFKDNELYNISSINNSENKKISENQNIAININKKKNNSIPFEISKTEYEKSQIEKNKDLENNIYLKKEKMQNFIFNIYKKEGNNYKDVNNYISFNVIDYFCLKKHSKKYKYIEIYNKGNSFYRKKMDICHVFTLISVIEDLFIK